MARAFDFARTSLLPALLAAGCAHAPPQAAIIPFGAPTATDTVAVVFWSSPYRTSPAAGSNRVVVGDVRIECAWSRGRIEITVSAPPGATTPGTVLGAVCHTARPFPVLVVID